MGENLKCALLPVGVTFRTNMKQNQYKIDKAFGAWATLEYINCVKGILGPTLAEGGPGGGGGFLLRRM